METKKFETIIPNELFINVDVDGTLIVGKDDSFKDYELMPNVKEVLGRLYNTKKCHFGIWTCRSDWQVENAIKFFEEQGIMQYFEHVNGDFEEIIEVFGVANRKSSADLYLDDRAIFHEIDWLEIEENIMKILEQF